jgi:arsenate reductase
MAKSWRAYGYEFGFDAVISTCRQAEKSCPTYPIGKRLHWEFPDPAAAKGTEEGVLQVFRTVRDTIKKRIEIAVKNNEI